MSTSAYVLLKRAISHVHKRKLISTSVLISSRQSPWEDSMNMQRRRVFKSSIALGVACLILCTPLTSQAWAAGGHMMVAQIALARLNPRAKVQVNALLALPINPAAISSQSKDFVNAAHWADDLRPFPEFDVSKNFTSSILRFQRTEQRYQRCPLPTSSRPLRTM